MVKKLNCFTDDELKRIGDYALALVAQLIRKTESERRDADDRKIRRQKNVVRD